MYDVTLPDRSTAPSRRILAPVDVARFDAALARHGAALGGRRIWHVNSTSTGGGVAEMLSSLLPYATGVGTDVRWAVIDGNAEFFAVTKRIHNYLHDNPGDRRPLDAAARAAYDATLDAERVRLQSVVAPGDAVVLHDPQTAGLAPPLRRHGALVVWRCHVGVDRPGPLARAAWRFLAADVKAAHMWIFSRAAHVWDGLDPERVALVPPSIDVLAPKNHPLDDATRNAILRVTGLQADGRATGPMARHGDATPRFLRGDGTTDFVTNRAQLVEECPVPSDAALVVQVSRWDRLKDPVGVLVGFAAGRRQWGDRAHLVLAGPSADAVDDDPEGAEVFADVCDAWHGLGTADRRAVHLACVRADDPDENSAVVNALQRRADVVVQKSLAEGFGLTVAESMWKHRPVVASRTGGIQDQIVDGTSGLLVEPDDGEGLRRAIDILLTDSRRAARIGAAAHRRVRERFLPANHFEHEAAVLQRIDS
jgi:trehalose synthase